MTDVEPHMRRALALAAGGRGHVEPNPMVGAVVLDTAGAVVGEGWHRRYGGPHAEVEALAAAGDRARGGTLVVTLEPCCHHGKTPPCTEAVLRAGVRRVVAAMPDPFPRVAGGGLQVLRDAGLDVQVGLLAAVAERLNAAYLKLVRTGLPWVHLKWAMALDGKLATRTGDSQWISSDESRRRVHELRGRVDAVVVGRRTVEADDPLLTARPPGPRTPTRVVLCRSGVLPERCRLRATARDVPVVVYVASGNESRLAGWVDDGVEVVGVGGEYLPEVLADLGRRRFTHVLVEGGAGVHGAFVDAAAFDEVHAFIAPVVAGGDAAASPVGGAGAGRMADALRLADVTATPSGADVYVHGFRR